MTGRLIMQYAAQNLIPSTTELGGKSPNIFFADVMDQDDVLLGDIDGCPFYIDKRLDEAWHQDVFLLDVAAGEPEDFSLPAGDDLHFVTLSPACATPGTPKGS